MPHVQSYVHAGEVWTGEGYVYMEIARYSLPDGSSYWLTDDIIFPEYAAAAEHLTRLGLTPYDIRSDSA